MGGMKKLGAWVTRNKDGLKELAIWFAVGFVGGTVAYGCGFRDGFVVGEQHQADMFSKLLK